MSRKKAVIKHKSLLAENLLKSSDIEIRLFSNISCQDCIPNNVNFFTECDFPGYQRNLIDPGYWTHDVANPPEYQYATTSLYSPIIYNNFSVDSKSVKGYFAVKQSTNELLFYASFSETMILLSYDSFSLELSFSLDKYFYKNPKLLNLTIYINRSNGSYINGALLQIKNITYNGTSCDECIKDILGFSGNFYNNSYFLSIDQNIINASGFAISTLNFNVSVTAPGFVDHTQSVSLSPLNQNSYVLNINMVEI